MTKRLDGRIAVVTGGAAGIGRTIAQKLAEEGADVAVLDVNPAPETEALVKASGRRFVSAVGSIDEEDSVNAFADRAREELGDVDIVVNNAAIAMVPDFEDTSFDDWKNLFSVNVNGPFLITKAFLQDLKNSAHGRVINMSSSSYWEAPERFVAGPVLDEDSEIEWVSRPMNGRKSSPFALVRLGHRKFTKS